MSWMQKIFVWLENISLKVSNSVICINENLRRELIDRSNLKKEIYIVPNAVNFNQIKQQWPRPPEQNGGRLLVAQFPR